MANLEVIMTSKVKMIQFTFNSVMMFTIKLYQHIELQIIFNDLHV